MYLYISLLWGQNNGYHYPLHKISLICMVTGSLNLILSWEGSGHSQKHCKETQESAKSPEEHVSFPVAAFWISHMLELLLLLFVSMFLVILWDKNGVGNIALDVCILLCFFTVCVKFPCLGRAASFWALHMYRQLWDRVSAEALLCSGVQHS